MRRPLLFVFLRVQGRGGTFCVAPYLIFSRAEKEATVTSGFDESGHARSPLPLVALSPEHLFCLFCCVVSPRSFFFVVFFLFVPHAPPVHVGLISVCTESQSAFCRVTRRVSPTYSKQSKRALPLAQGKVMVKVKVTVMVMVG